MNNSNCRVKIKILFILHLPPPIHGAALMGAFIKNSEIINNTYECDYINLATAKKLNVGILFVLPNILRYVQIITIVLFHLLKNRYDLCYITLNSSGIAFYKDLIVALLTKLFKNKIVYHFHNKGVVKNQHKLLDNILYKIAFNKVDCIVAAENLKMDLEKYVLPKNIHVCPNGIPDLKQISIRNEINKDQEIPIILFLSNMMKAKGVFDLLNGLSLLNRKGIKFKASFVGEWKDINPNEFYNLRNKLNLADCVEAYGAKYNEDKFRLINSSDIFVFPSFNECFPLVLLEAMQSKLPIVSTNEGGIPNLVDDGKTGFLIKKHDINALAEKIELLITDKKLRLSMGLAGHDKYKKEYTLEKYNARLIEIFNKILAG